MSTSQQQIQRYGPSYYTLLGGVVPVKNAECCIYTISGHDKLHEAIDEFKKLLSVQEKSELEQGKPPFNAIEITNALNKSKKTAKLASRCGPFIQSIQQFSGIVDTMIQHNPFISALAWGSVKFLLLVRLGGKRFLFPGTLVTGFRQPKTLAVILYN